MSKNVDILFVHNNFPAQYKLIAAYLSKLPEFRVFAIGAGTATEQDGIRLQRYSVPAGSVEASHPFARRFDLECRRAEQVIYAANVLKLSGMSPRLIFVHPGWGESLPLKQIFPAAKICLYCEFYYRTEGADVGFDPEFGPYGIDGLTRIRLRNAATLLGLVDAEVGVAPMNWQRDLFPHELRSKIQVIHDGIDTDALQPHRTTFAHPQLPRALQTGDEVLTFVARNLEPYRGFHIFMRALPRILAERPDAVVCVVGGNDVSYGNPPAGADNWKAALGEELRGSLDLGRVHFLGTLPYEQYLALLGVSRVHTYLTYPFVLSWSLIEALALECVVVASDTGPVREVIRTGENGLLVPFFDREVLAEKIVAALAAPERFASLGKRARAEVVRDFSFDGAIRPRFMALIDELLASGASVAS